jgi:hypothetical protein
VVKIKEIHLVGGVVVLIDDDIFDYLMQFKWYAWWSRSNRYVRRSIKKENGRWSAISMHQEVMGKKDGYIIDHIDGNGLNNQRSNLRHVTNRQNCQNKHTYKTSKYPGVAWKSYRCEWESNIRVDGVNRALGYFKTELEAFLVYKNAVKKLTGEEVLCDAII